MSDTSLTKFQTLLKKLFLSEYADLDFGIYRILNARRRDIEQFIETRLPQIVSSAFDTITQDERAQLQAEESRLVKEIKTILADDAIEPDGQIAFTYANSKLGKQHTEARKKLAALSVSDTMQERVYNDLFTFFNRYYDDGDFMALRRRGSGETYAVPYNGEEVLLHWANRDQYYVKSGDRFNAYRFTIEGVQIAVEIKSADVATNNNKTAKRYFILAGENPVAFDAEKSVLTVAFAFRALTAVEEEQFGRTETSRPQEKINEVTEASILVAIPDAALKAALQTPENPGEAPRLRKRLMHFTKRSTSDFFVHKDLRGFLLRELDFYLKNDVLLLDELLNPAVISSSTAVGDEGQEGAIPFRRARALRAVAVQVIDFLATVEKFQKRLFEKRKFILSTRYAATLYHVPETLWPEILANAAQTAEWQELYSLDTLLQKDGMYNNGLSADFLRENKALMVDTQHFDSDFTSRLLASLPNLDAATDGVCFNSDNFQALRLI